MRAARSRTRGPVLAAMLALGAGCDGEQVAPSAPPSVDLGGDAVAVVGSSTIAAGTVRRVAHAQGVSPADARARAVRDALFAEEARARGVDAVGLEATVLTRALFETIRREAAGPVTDAELEEVTERHWVQLRRPEGVRVIHAVARVPTRGRAATDEETARAFSVARAIRDAVTAASERARREPRGGRDDPAAAAFENLASRVDARGLEVKIEVLDPFTREGRVIRAGGGGFDRAFVEAAWPLQHRGDLTEPFSTPFGAHVAMLLERTPAHEVPVEERRRLVAAEVIDDRIRARRQALLEEGRGRVELAPNAAALLDLVQVR